MNEPRERLGVIGIDPGLNGAVAPITPDGAEARVTPTLASGGDSRQFDVPGMLDLLERHPMAIAVIEAVGPRPGQRLSSSFRFGAGHGLWLGMLAALRIPHVAVTPQAWKNAIQAGTSKDKAAPVQSAQRRFPEPRCRP